MTKKVQLDVGINTTGLKTAMRGASDYGKQQLEKELSDNKRILDQIVSLRKKSSEQIARDNVKASQARINTINKEVAIYQKAAKAIEQSATKAANAQNQRGRMILKAGGLGAQMMGQNTIGYAMRMNSVAGIGTEMVGGMSNFALGGIGVALGGLVVASKLVEVGFDALSSVVTSTAGAFIGAMTTLGGFRGLQGSIQASARREDMMGAARMTVSPEERLSNAELQQRARGFGNGFSEEEGIKAFGQLGRFSAQQKSVSQQEQNFIAQSALVSRDAEGNVDLAKSAHMYALLRAQGNTAEQAQSIMRNSIAIGQHTSMGPEDLVANPGITQLTTMLGGDKQTNYSKIFGLEGAINKYTGNVGESSTQAFGVMQGLRKMHMAGHDVGSWKDDKMVDINSSIGALSKMSDATLKSEGFGNRKEGLEGLASLEAAAKDAGVGVKEYLDSISDLTMTQDQLNSDSKDMMDTTQELKASFNDITNVIADSTKEELKALSITLKDLVKSMVDNKDTISQSIKGMSETFADVTIISAKLAEALAYLAYIPVKLFGLANKIGFENIAESTANALSPIPGLGSTGRFLFDTALGEKGNAAKEDISNKIDSLASNGIETFIKGLESAGKAAEDFKDTLHGAAKNVPNQPDTSGGFGVKKSNNPMDQG